MRLRQRYLAIRIHGMKALPSESTLRTAIWHRLQELYGELGVSRIGFWLISYLPKKSSLILRCQHDQVRPLRAALATITQINSGSLLFQVVGISGTLRKAVTLLPSVKAQEVIKLRKHR